MTKVASMKVQVSADTSRFDAAMHRVRGQLRETAGASSVAGAAVGGPTAGRLAAGLQIAALSGPMLAMAGAAAALSAAVSEVQRDRDRGRQNLDDLGAGLGVQEQAQFQRVANIAGSGTASDVAKLLQLFRGDDWRQQNKLTEAGVMPDRLASIAAASDREALRMLVELAKSPNGAKIAEALGGGAGNVFRGLGRVLDVGVVDRAMASATSGTLVRQAALDELARQDRASRQDPNQPGSLSSLFNRITSQSPSNVFLDYERSRRGISADNAERLLREIADKSGGPE